MTVFNNIASLLLLLSGLVSVASVNAHQQSDTSPGTLVGGALRQNTLSMSASIAAYSGESPGSRTYPAGLLVSDEAGYSADGLSLQAWSASLEHPLSESSWASVGVGTHGGHGDTSDPTVEVEELTLSHYWKAANGSAWLFRLGQQSVAPQPWLNWHADVGVESSPSLLGDVFLARHRVDTGLSSQVLLGQTRLGVNVWNGDAWPATAGEGAVDLTLDHALTVKGLALDAGFFLSASKAVDRGGEDSSHSHSSDETAILFSGDTRLAGVSLGVSSDTHSQSLWSAHTALLSSHESGDLTVDAQQAGIISETQGVRLHGQVERAGYGIWLRHEWLSIDNQMTGAGGQAMAELAGIADAQGRPSRTVLGSWWDALPGVRWQVALEREDDGVDEGWAARLAVQWSQQWKL